MPAPAADRRPTCLTLLNPISCASTSTFPRHYSQAAKPGLTADLTLSEFPGRRFQGRLVRTAEAIDPASRTLLVEIDVVNPTGVLLTGSYAEVHLKLPAGSSSYRRSREHSAVPQRGAPVWRW